MANDSTDLRKLADIDKINQLVKSPEFLEAIQECKKLAQGLNKTDFTTPKVESVTRASCDDCTGTGIACSIASPGVLDLEFAFIAMVTKI